MEKNNRIKNYIFDFGQVIVKFDTEYMTSVCVENNDDIKTVEKVVFDRLYWDRLDAGTITDNEVKKGICSRLPERLHKEACEVYDNWYKNLEFIEGMPELIKEIKANGGRLYLLSNISNTFAQKYKTVPMLNETLGMFAGLVFSATVGLTKPNKEIYQYILNEYKLNPEETVFIDDNEKNTLAAKEAGICGYLFEGNVNELKGHLIRISKTQSITNI